MSNIASLEAELSRQRSINNELRSELNTITYGVQRAHDRLENFNSRVCNALDGSFQHLNASQSKMLAALETQAEIEALYVRFKAMELANKRIRDCNNRKYYEFANYTKVRKLVQGVMDNLDVNMASDRVIYKSVERQHLQTPDYWLTCVLLSIMAWKNDDKPLADRAMGIALELDKKSSSIFYMLFNLRMHRENVALKWFEQYQQCDLKGSDQRTFLLLFALISRCINSSEELSEPAREEINKFIHRVIDMSINAEGYSREEMVAIIIRHLSSFVPNDQLDYPLLRKYSKEYQKYHANMMCAKANIAILDEFKEIIHVQPEQRNAFIKNFIDELIAKANDQEQEVYDEIAYNETIIRMEGDVDKAKEIFGQQKVHDAKQMNLIYEMIEWICGADKDDVNDQSRMNMFVLTKDLQREAIDKRTEAYRCIDRRHSQVAIGEYTTTMDFENAQNEKQKIKNFYAEARDSVLAGIKDWPAYVGFGVGLAAGVAAFFTSYALLIGTAAGAGFGLIKLFSNKSARKQAEQNFQENCRLGEETINSLCKEYEAFKAEFDSYDQYVDEIYRELDSI